MYRRKNTSQDLGGHWYESVAAGVLWLFRAPAQVQVQSTRMRWQRFVDTS
jgi:hypothetical protein